MAAKKNNVLPYPVETFQETSLKYAEPLEQIVYRFDNGTTVRSAAVNSGISIPMGAPMYVGSQIT